jgi:hypothetical protein
VEARVVAAAAAVVQVHLAVLGDLPRLLLPGQARRPAPVAVEHLLRAVEERAHLARVPVGAPPAQRDRVGGSDERRGRREAAAGGVDARQRALGGDEAAPRVARRLVRDRKVDGRGQRGGVD